MCIFFFFSVSWFLANKKGNFLSSDLEGQEKDERRVRTGTQREDAGEIDNIVERVENIVERVQCTTIHKSESSKRGEDLKEYLPLFCRNFISWHEMAFLWNPESS